MAGLISPPLLGKGGVIVFEDLDQLARGLAENDVSRRQAIKWPGYSVLGAALSSVGFAESAKALSLRARNRCRGEGGIPLEEGNCHCAATCVCFQTTEGTGFCAGPGSGGCGDFQACTQSSQYPAGTKCVVNTYCGTSICVPDGRYWRR